MGTTRTGQAVSTVVVPYQSSSGQIRSFRSTNGGTSWGTSVLVFPIRHHGDAGGLRSGALPSAEIDAAGTTYVAWSDCRFRTGCPANDIVVSRSTTGATWTAPARVPIDATSTNGGTTWSASTQVAGPMNLSWLPSTSQGRMFGDYISTSVRRGGNAFPVVPIGHAPTGTTFDLAMYVPTGGLPITGGTRRAGPCDRWPRPGILPPARYPL